MAFLDNAGVSYLWSKIKAALKGKQDTLTFDNTPTAGSSNPVTSDGVKAAIDAATEIFYVPFKFGATGFELDGGTHADIMAAYQEGKRIVGKGYVPSAANLGWSGMFELPLSFFADNSSFVLTLTSGQNTCESWVKSDNTIVSYIRTLVSFNDNVTGELNASSTDTQIPSAKAVYDYIESRLNGLTFKSAASAPTVDDDSVITFVNEG